MLYIALTISGSGCGFEGPPQITTQTLPAGAVGQAYSQFVTATDGQPPYAWSLLENPAALSGCQSVLPAGLNITTEAASGRGRISGVPEMVGEDRYAIQVKDSAGAIDGQCLTIKIVDRLGISTTKLPDGSDDIPYNAQVSVSGGLSPFNFALRAGGLPAGLTLNSATGVISGEPTEGGTFAFTVSVNDSLAPPQTVQQAYEIRILEITFSSLSAGRVGQRYRALLAGPGVRGEIGAVQWRLVSGSLPPGTRVLNIPGLLTDFITGTPTQAGTFTFDLQVTDQATNTDASVRRSDKQTLNLTINP